MKCKRTLKLQHNRRKYILPKYAYAHANRVATTFRYRQPCDIAGIRKLSMFLFVVLLTLLFESKANNSTSLLSFLATITMVNYIPIRRQTENSDAEALRQGQRHDLLIRYILLFAFALCICVTLLPLCLLMLNPNVMQQQQKQHQRLVCYFSTSGPDQLSLLDVPGDLCTHINIGTADLFNKTLQLSPRLEQVLQKETRLFRAAHPQVKLLLWIGGADSGHQFADMVLNHARRKQFLRSLREVLRKYPSLDGIDLDWEFPSAHDKERMHFCQLLHEIRLEWRRERRTSNLLTMAVAAPEGIAFFAYNIREINLYVDYVNLMSYDFHFYREDTPFTGLNAPLYARSKEHSIMGTFNINYTVHWWLKNGLEPQRLVIGLPTYGHSFTLVSALNTRIGAPASGIGKCGQLGFTTLSETCECANTYVMSKYTFDNDTCSPYLSAVQEWISYESKTSISCKANYVKSLNVGGLMLFSLNSDDLKNSCGYMPRSAKTAGKPVFPLAQAASSILRKSRGY